MTTSRQLRINPWRNRIRAEADRARKGGILVATIGGAVIYPQAYQPYQQPWQQPAQSVVRVSGIDSARQLRLPPNSSMLALDYDDHHVYAVASDGAGVVAAKAYTLEPCEAPQASGGFVTENQFSQFKEEINERLSQLRSGCAGDSAAGGADEPR